MYLVFHSIYLYKKIFSKVLQKSTESRLKYVSSGYYNNMMKMMDESFCFHKTLNMWPGF